MKNRKLVILWVLVPLAAISLIYGVVSPGKKGGKRVSPAATASGPAEPATPVPALSQRHPKKGSQTLWGRNPFVPPQVSLQGISEKGLILHGILWEEAAPRAVINGRIVRAGDRIQGYHVVKIEKDRVTLTDGTTAFELKLGRKK